ncbi:hypothetical protein [Capnocytophaga sp. oral taxon 338]|uniref:hypothetical protein n=1 Tax=Capnocytophaga sp. oral taxon 338 TaxID=710239 RepID=UPI000202ED5B|nr:hypothetical protein [Capnocytophaga sp. oral taxon 338]EGD33574.1 hypothetical protein HMPREF9071_1736 [Capnocytophaga sp. oral taxon 338 str. F0234]
MDTEILTKGNLNCKITAVSQKGNVFTKFKDLKFSYKQVNWVDVRIDRPNKIIQATVRINLRDGGAVGLDSELKAYVAARGMGSEETVLLEMVPSDIVKKYGQPTLKARTRSFEDLRDLALQGVERYWSRRATNWVGKNVKIGDDFYQVIVKGCVRSNVDDLPVRDIVVYFPSNSEDYSFRNILLATDIKTNEKGLFYIRENRQDIKEYLFYLIYHDSIIKEVNLKDNKSMNSFLEERKKDTFDIGIVYFEKLKDKE